MATKNLGKVAITPRGEWSAGTYEKLDVVSFAGSSYLSRKDGNTSAVTVVADWLKIASKGDQGTAGNGWQPLLVADTTAVAGKTLLKLSDWIGGSGTKPTTNVGQWQKADGTYTSVAAEANNIKGDAGSGEIVEVSYNHTANEEINIASIDIGANVFTKTAHGLANGDVVVPTTNNLNSEAMSADYMLPLKVFVGGITPIRYFVINTTSNTFQISTTNGGTAVALSTNATMDLSKWHFEKNPSIQLDFTSLTPSMNYLVRFISKIGHGGLSFNPKASGMSWGARNWATNQYDSLAAVGSVTPGNVSGYLFGSIQLNSVGQANYQVLAHGRTINNATSNSYQTYIWSGFHTNFHDDSINNKNITELQINGNGGFLNGTKIIIYRK